MHLHTLLVVLAIPSSFLVLAAPVPNDVALGIPVRKDDSVELSPKVRRTEEFDFGETAECVDENGGTIDCLTGEKQRRAVKQSGAVESLIKPRQECTPAQEQNGECTTERDPHIGDDQVSRVWTTWAAPSRTGFGDNKMRAKRAIGLAASSTNGSGFDGRDVAPKVKRQTCGLLAGIRGECTPTTGSNQLHTIPISNWFDAPAGRQLDDSFGGADPGPYAKRDCDLGGCTGEPNVPDPDTTLKPVGRWVETIGNALGSFGEWKRNKR